MRSRCLGGALGLLLLGVCAACGFAGEEVADIPLPASARRLDTRSTRSDFHGDHGTWFTYALSAEHARSYAVAPLWWMREGAGKWESWTEEIDPSPRVAWREGPLGDDLAYPVSGFERAGADFGQRSVRYAYKEVVGGWRRLVVIDVAERRLYYFRETW